MGSGKAGPSKNPRILAGHPGAQVETDGYASKDRSLAGVSRTERTRSSPAAF